MQNIINDYEDALGTVKLINDYTKEITEEFDISQREVILTDFNRDVFFHEWDENFIYVYKKDNVEKTLYSKYNRKFFGLTSREDYFTVIENKGRYFALL
jgi:hypothetical protein